MGMGMSGIGEVFSGIVQGLDGLFTSDDERLQAKGVIMAGQNQVVMRVVEYEQAILEQQSSIIRAEAAGESWLQRNWRPVVMLTLMATIMADMFALTGDHVTQATRDSFMTLVQIGLGGYVVGRSGEKIVKSLQINKVTAKDK